MENIKISQVCGLCAGCTRAIDTAVKEVESGKKVTIFKEIVHNKNVNSYLESIGAKCEESIENLTSDSVVIIRAHGEPPETFEYLKNKGIDFRDCTCLNVSKIHELVKEYSEKGYAVIILGKHKKALHPEVFGTIGWAKTDVVLIESSEDVEKLKELKNDKFYLVCQTTFNMKKADELISEIQDVLKSNNSELVVNKSLCLAQKTINEFSAKLATESDVMIVVGGSNSSNSIELFKNVSSICPSIFIEDIYSYKDALKDAGLEITSQTRVGITAGASTRKEELVELKKLIENDLKN
jgi:4-hydroxy-3-methylbut-2-enyl diphosphate reductase